LTGFVRQLRLSEEQAYSFGQMLVPDVGNVGQGIFERHREAAEAVVRALTRINSEGNWLRGVGLDPSETRRVRMILGLYDIRPAAHRSDPRPLSRMRKDARREGTDVDLEDTFLLDGLEKVLDFLRQHG
jgi:hypothetical protein